MKTRHSYPRIKTQIRNLDEILGGGLPRNSLTVVAGTPGAGKTIFSQQVAFANASPDRPALIFHTLSEPAAKTLRFLGEFTFFDQTLLDNGSVQFVDLGDILKNRGLEQSANLILENVKRLNPGFVIIDSFKAFEDLARSREEYRKFSYELGIHLMAWECTAFLLGEFDEQDIARSPIFSIADGLITLKVREQSGEQQRFIQVAKMRGTNHSRDEHSFIIDSHGLSIYAPRVTIRRDPQADLHLRGDVPLRTMSGISGLDELLDGGIPYGSSFLVAGVTGTGKTLLALEFIYRGATQFGEKGIFISFEETEERLRANAKSMGWDLAAQIERGNIEVMFIPQTDILVERHLLMIQERIQKLRAKRIAVDSASLFFHKVESAHLAREKIFQLATLVQMSQAVGAFVIDIPYGSNQISRFGVEETVVDGVILLTAQKRGMERERFLEVYKLRNTAHRVGMYRMIIGSTGIRVEARRPDIVTRTGTDNEERKKAG